MKKDRSQPSGFFQKFFLRDGFFARSLFCSGALVSFLLLEGCEQASLRKLSKSAKDESTFTAALAREYLTFAAREENKYYDQVSAGYFARKGLDAAMGSTVPPELVDRWRIPEEKIDELKEAREQLLAALRSPEHVRHAEDLATAQVNFDCWLEEQEENWQFDNIAFCKSNFFEALNRTHEKVHAARKQANPDPLLPTNPYAVYYKPGKVDVPPSAEKVIQQLLTLIRSLEKYKIVVDGHADLVGTRVQNREISEKRAGNMKQALVTKGIPDQRIRAFGHSNHQATGKKGVPNPRDRRVDITLLVPEDKLAAIK